MVGGVVEGFDEERVGGAEERLDGGVEMKQRDHRRGCGQAKLDVELRDDEQGVTPNWFDVAGWGARVLSLAWLVTKGRMERRWERYRMKYP